MKKLKDILFEQVEDNEPILVKGVGQYTYGTLKRNLQQKTQDILDRVRKDDFNLSDSDLEIFCHFFRTLRNVTNGLQPPMSTMIKK
jgi:hypothetical protein